MNGRTLLPRLLWLSGLVFSTPTSALASTTQTADEVFDLLTGKWYAIEFFVFERGEVMDFNTDEALTLFKPRQYPFNIVAQRPGAIPGGPPGESPGDLPNEEGYEAFYDLDSATKLSLVYPTLEYTTSESFGEQANEPATGDGLPVSTEVPEATETIVDQGTAPPLIEPELEPNPLLDFLATVALFEEELDAASDRWLGADTFLLARDARLVTRRGIGRILHHGRWIQAVPARDDPRPILLQAGDLLVTENPIHELEGTIAVTLGRYLHFEADLAFHAPALGGTPVEVILRNDGGIAAEMPEFPQGGYMHLRESRRMRSEVVHYLDHPKFGIVVRIDPIEIPLTLIEEFEALEEPEASAGDGIQALR